MSVFMLELELKKTYIQNPLTGDIYRINDELYYKKLNQSLETVLISISMTWKQQWNRN
jgi:hypothetical protein